MARFQLTREMFIPKDAVLVESAESDAVAYLFINSLGKPSMKVFYGKQTKPVAFYYYRNEQERMEAVEKYFAARVSALAAKKERAEARKNAPNPFNVGDVLRCSWGATMMINDWYEVLESKGKTVLLRELRGQQTQTYADGGTDVPVLGEHVGVPFKARVVDGAVKIDRNYARLAEFTLVNGEKVFKPCCYYSD